MTGWNSDRALISRVMRLLPGLHGRPGQAAGHQGGHGPQDHGFAAGGEASVIAGGAAVPADPGEPPLCGPATGRDLEGVRVALGGDLDRHRHGGGPGGELAGADGAGQDQADAAAGAVEVPQQRPDGVAVRGGRGGDHGRQQARRVHRDVPFPAVRLFRVIPAPAGASGTCRRRGPAGSRSPPRPARCPARPRPGPGSFISTGTTRGRSWGKPVTTGAQRSFNKHSLRNLRRALAARASHSMIILCSFPLLQLDLHMGH